tara:strand:+ start:141607 stop:142461 length:855 start_codon:yes stop_codon:yes gene_type:complete
MVTEEWLNKLNEEFAKADMPHMKRPFEAWERYSLESKVSSSLDSPEVKKIFAWFKQNTKEDAHQVGSIYSSVYYFDAEFWDVHVPVFYGTVNFDPVDALSNMPEGVKQRLRSDEERTVEYVLHWADCFDFGVGYLDVAQSKTLNKFGLDMLKGGYEELTSAASLLGKSKFNPRAILDARMALEMFMKSYAAMKGRLTEAEAKKIGHDLHAGLQKFLDVSGMQDIKAVSKHFGVYPEVHDRYKATKTNKAEQWKGFHLAQSMGALVIREFSDNGAMTQIVKQLKG